MPKAARIVFAKDPAANIVAASDFFASSHAAYFCVACDKELQRKVPEGGSPYFVHVRRTTCRLAAHYALRAAAQHVLLESRFIKVPLVGGEAGAGRIQSLLIQWTDSIADIEVVHVRVDFLAETADGQLIVEIAIPGLPPAVPLERVEKLAVPALVVSLPDPARINGWADLRHCVLHSIERKSWLFPLEKALRRSPPVPGEEWHAPSIPGVADKRTPSSWTSPLVFADNAVYRQLSHAERLGVLQTQMARSCDQWPADVDIEVRGDDAFGVEVVRRLAARKLPDAIRVVDFGIRGFDLAYALMEGYAVTILVDATPRGGEPGTLYTIEPDLRSVPAPQTGVSSAIDAHSMDPVRVMSLVKALGGEFKRILIVGCEPEALDAEEQMQGRMGLSEPVERAVGKAADVIVSLTAKLLAEPGETLTKSSRETTLPVNP